MNALTFDTLKAARRLRDEFGFDERQATGIVETFADGMSLSLDALATRQDLAALRADMKADIALLRADMKADIALLRADMAAQENRMTIKLGAMIAAAAGFLVVVDKLL